MARLPSGTVTFLFTDIEGSTRLFERHPEAMEAALARHHELLRQSIGARRGEVFQVVGDGLCAVFADAGDAVEAALAGQRVLGSERWAETGALRVRMGMHTGNGETRDGEYLSSLTLARTQRVCAAAHGGQLLLSAATAREVRSALPSAATLRDLGAHKLRGIAEAESLYQLVAADLPSDFPPLLAEVAAGANATPLQQLVRGQLVGRSAELAQLVAHWDLAQQARGQLVLLSGEPGVGKTRLAQDLIAHAQPSGATLLHGGCYEFEATTPYLPFLEAFRDWTRRQSPEHLRQALGATASEIVKLAPEIAAKLGEVPTNAALPPREERLRLFDNVSRFVAALAADNGVLLFIDDLHWADQGTLSLLHYLLRHLRDDRVLVLAAYREVELDRTHPLAAALVEWNRERLATRLALGRLSHRDTAAMLARMFGVQSVSEEFAAALYGETEGNPFFIEEVVKSLIEQGEIYREGTGWGRKATHELAIPQSIKEAIGRRLSRLGEHTVEVLRSAAALGKRFRFGELAAIMSSTDDALLDALDEATVAQLVRFDSGSAKWVEGGDDAFAFTHDKIREVLQDEVNPVRRRRLHQRIGEALEKLYAMAVDEGVRDTRADDHAQDLAYHFMQAGDLARCLAYAQRAARNAERLFAHDDALKFMEQARDAAEALQRGNALPAIDEHIGDIHNTRGIIQAAVASYERALGGTAEPSARAALKAKIGHVYCVVGDSRGLRYLEEALAELDPAAQTNELAQATALMGRYYHYRAEHRRALTLLERARVLAEPLADPLTLSLIQSYLAGAHQHLLEFEASDRWSRANIALGERRKFSFATATGYEFLAENAANRGYWNDALAYAAKEADEATRSGALARKAWSSFCTAQSLHGKGQLGRAREVAEAALTLADQIGESRLATWLGAIVACTCADLGDDGAAQAIAERNLVRAGALNQMLVTAWALHAHGFAAMQRGDYSAAVDWYERYLPLVRETENGAAKLLILPDCAEAFCRGGRHDEGYELAERAIAVADFAVAPHRRAIARRAQARVLAARGDLEAARSACDEAIALLHSVGGRLEWARTLCLRAELAGSRQDLLHARDAFAETGASRDLAYAESLLKESP